MIKTLYRTAKGISDINISAQLQTIQ
jgi:hypothetical protein